MKISNSYFINKPNNREKQMDKLLFETGYRIIFNTL